MGLFQILTNPENFKFYSQAQNSGPNNKTLSDSFGQKSFTFGDANQPYVITPPPENVKFLTPIDYEKSTKKLVGGLFSGFTTTGTKSNLFPYLGSVFASLPNQIRYNPKSWGPDFLNRGNLFGYLRAADDVERLSKYFFDFKSFSGPLFIIKQNLLSTIGVKTESSRGTAYGGGFINEGIYSPTSTIAQASVGFLGVFLNKQGIDPTGLIPQLKINSYQDSIYVRQYETDPNNKGQNENRLISLNNKSSLTSLELKYKNDTLFVGYTLLPNANTLLKYDGGPGSVYGIGTTKIKYATDNTGKNPITLPRTPLEILNIKGGNVFTWANSDFISQSLNIDQSTTEDFRKKLLDNPVISPINLLACVSFPLSYLDNPPNKTLALANSFPCNNSALASLYPKFINFSFVTFTPDANLIQGLLAFNKTKLLSERGLLTPSPCISCLLRI